MGVQNPNSTGYVHPDEPNLLNIHKAMEYNSLGQPVIRVLCESGGGTMDLTALSVVTTSSYLGGSLSYNNTTGVFTFAPADLTSFATTSYVNGLKDRIVSPNDQYATYIDNTGTTYSAGDIIPGTAVSNLGSTSQPWKDVYVSKGSIVIADNDINVDGVSISNTAKYLVIDRGGLKVTSTTVAGREVFQLDGTGKLLLKSEIPLNTDSAAFEVIGSLLGESLPIVNRGVMIHSSGAINVPSRIYIDGVGTQTTAPYETAYAAFIGRYARNTVADPQPAQAGDLIVRFGGNAMADELGLNSISNVRVDMRATELQSSTGRGSRIEFWTTDIGSAVPSLSAHIDSQGIDLSEAADATAGITFWNGSTLKYWPSQTNKAGKILRTDGTNFFWDNETVPSGQVLFKGDWSAANPPGGGTPTISDATGQAGWQWIVSAAGTQDLGSGNITFAVGDLVIHNGTRYIKIESTTPQVQVDWNDLNTGSVSHIVNRPILATVATSGSYFDLPDRPSIPAAQLASNWNTPVGGGVTEILNKPSIVNNITTGTGIRVSTSTGVVQVSFANDGGYITSSALNGYTTTATVNTLIANSLTNYTTTATVNTLIANSLTNFVYTGTVKLSVSTAASGTSALSFTTSTGVLTFTPPNLSAYLTTVTNVAYANTATNLVGGYVSSITAGTGTAVSTSTGAVTIWTVPQAITSTGSTTTTNYTIDLSGPTFVHWQPTANGNQTVTLTGFTPGRKVQVFITPHRAQDIFTFTGVTFSQCSNGVNTFVLGGGGVAQNSMMIDIFCTTNAISGVWIFGFGSQ